MPTERQRWVKRKFVVLSELLGYALASAVFAGVIATLFIQVDVSVKATAELRPICHDVTSVRDFLLVESPVANGGHVVVGQPVARVLVEMAAQHRSLARRQLRASLSLLEAEPGSSAGVAAKRLREALADLPSSEDFETITTSHAGFLRQIHVPWEDGVLPGGTAAALVCEFQTLEMKGQLITTAVAAKLAVGQRARAFAGELGGVLTGEVVEARHGLDGTDFRLQFTQTPSATQDLIRERFVNSADGKPLLLQAEIVVGRRSVFMEMLRRGK